MKIAASTEQLKEIGTNHEHCKHFKTMFKDMTHLDESGKVSVSQHSFVCLS